MNYNINDILPYVENYNFGEYFTTKEEDFLVSSVPCDDELSFDWEDGASKLVIIPEDKDYVIKIPFNGEYDEYNKKYYDFSYNYCETEIELYDKIFKENPIFIQFFLPLIRVEEFRKWDVYIQPKCQAYNNTDERIRSKSYSKESLTKAEKVVEDILLPTDWVAAVAEVLQDISLVMEFINILSKYDIMNDLHKGNIGYCNGKPVILDYANFYD